MTADPHTPNSAPRKPLYASLTAWTPLAGASRRPEGPNGPQTGVQSLGVLRVLVTGSRNWPTPAVVWAALNDVRDEALLADRHLVVVHGSCPKGADSHAARWCAIATQFANGVTEEPHPAQWRDGNGRLDRAAGPRRNADMVRLGADIALAFIRNGSRGASHAAALAEQAGIPVRRYTA